VDWNEKKIPKRKGNYERKKKSISPRFRITTLGKRELEYGLASLIISNSKRKEEINIYQKREEDITSGRQKFTSLSRGG
jgi:hypothetical protein